jgi:hypothetical protein
MATVESQIDAIPPQAISQVAGTVPTTFRFGLRHLFEALTGAAIVAWAVMSYSTTYEVYGLVQSGVVWVAILLGAIATLPLLFVLRMRTLCRLWMLALVAFSLRQAMFAKRLAALRTEVAAIIEYVDNHKLQHGLYPTDLSGYQFIRPELASYIEYRDAYPTTSYEIRWHPIHLDGIAHWYGADYGHYFEDD